LASAADDKPKKDPPKAEAKDVADALEIVKKTNEERVKKGLKELKVNATLTKVAQGHSANMAKQMKMEHVLDGKKPGDRVKEAGYKFEVCGENVGWGGKGWTVQHMMKSWMDSPAHAKNILHEEFTEIGVAIATAANGDRYFTQVFAAP
jgi:uncharacterized protein YkwD